MAETEERESSEEKRARQDKEKDEARKERQVRLGHVEKPKKANAKKNNKDEDKAEE